MANKIILDFETGIISWDTDSQKGTEFCPDLAERKPVILAAMGYETVDFTPAVDIINTFVNGKITEEEFKKRIEEFANDNND